MNPRNPYQYVSHDSRLHQLASDRNRTRNRVLIFGGTGAVGGAVVVQLIRETMKVNALRATIDPIELDVIATGLTDRDIAYFVNRLILSFESSHIEKVRSLRHYRIGDHIRIRFRHFRVAIDIDSVRQVASHSDSEDFSLRDSLREIYAGMARPFVSFVEDFGELDGVVVAIPVASVMAYTMGVLDELAQQHGVEEDPFRLKEDFLREVVIRDLDEVSNRYSREVIIAHTTAVGGMYRVDGEGEQIALGFAHSASGKLLFEKKHFADFLTEAYRDSGFRVLITAAAIGIDAVMFQTHLPANSAIRSLLEGKKAVSLDDLSGTRAASIWLYPGLCLENLKNDADPLDFGSGEELVVDVAVRSGENGLFSIDNCYALYNVMKVTVPEELALVVSRQILFGDEPHREFFENGVCYFTETENARFALQVLSSDARLQRSQLGPLSVKAYQALGSSTHQGRLHELGLVILLLRLSSLKLESLSKSQLQTAQENLDDFLWNSTSPPYFEDFLAFDLTKLAEGIGRLMEVDGPESMASFLKFDLASHKENEQEYQSFLGVLAQRIQIYRSTITSLGIPILYRRPGGEDALLVGPYIAPMDIALNNTMDLYRDLEKRGRPHGVDPRTVWDWVVVNNGVVDVRPHALVTHAKDVQADLSDRVKRFSNETDLVEWLETIHHGQYFTTTGLIALRLRISRLWEKIRNRHIQLGTGETWKNLFQLDSNGKFLIVPGLVETMRMYAEGLGKTTGTETLWPGHGY